MDAFLHSFGILLVIMDPFGGVPIFLTLTKAFDKTRTRLSANRAIRVSFVLLIIFIFLGQFVLEFFGISVESFKIGGALILLILGVLYTLDINLYKQEAYSAGIIVPMATPLIAGPGTISAAIILVSLYGFWIPLVAVLLNLAIFWVAMYNAHHIKKLIGRQGVEILSSIMGLLLVALAVEMIVSGIGEVIAK